MSSTTVTNSQLDDIAELLISHLHLDDVPSLFELKVQGLDYAHPNYGPHTKYFCDVLKVTAPVEAGRRIFKIDYLDNHERPLAQRYEDSSARVVRYYPSGWQKITFDKDDWEGAVAFTDGFMSSGCRSRAIAYGFV